MHKKAYEDQLKLMQEMQERHNEYHQQMGSFSAVAPAVVHQPAPVIVPMAPMVQAPVVIQAPPRSASNAAPPGVADPRVAAMAVATHTTYPGCATPVMGGGSYGVPAPMTTWQGGAYYNPVPSSYQPPPLTMASSSVDAQASVG